MDMVLEVREAGAIRARLMVVQERMDLCYWSGKCLL